MNTTTLELLTANIALGLAVCVMVIAPLALAIRADHRAQGR
jgi:hypothetical protein